ncbi:Acetophenone carboxylase gamma subunit [Legionella gratiana]|uniref:Acetone carboxylase beta subunit n=1 Tax=Legionella gratiana TaxID=45066 RepID=A0A378JG12_9GAMM|nr:hydantoinase/oxoprolinase family protein [Legionella gratiana]KTD10947.1 Acetophenone carboxylase gamma subunit [Legionella gratiana]STX45921.1 Acetone carboxylase beta subunit [Legionella gratiana]
MKKQKWEFWIDRGGTFTDIVARSPEGRVYSDKLLSENPECYSNAAIQGIQNILQCTSIPTDEIAFIKMGTTVATNALLERRGAKVLLAITQGFGDALRIGYQNRPELFALNIKLPSLLYDEVIEINERIDAKGTVLQPLDEKDARQKMEKAYAKGYRTIAIVLMHAYQYTKHERKLKKIAQSIGFTQISISHEIAPVMKLVSRGDTTVVDAYLSPVLHGYIQGLRDKLSTIPLFFMQSNGGLVHAKLFQGKNSLFSGPAGGVIGMIKTSQHAGFNQVIGFDMGGTSTDVSHFAGEYERSFSYEFSGVHIRTPMMMIHTIAAGGGSILNFDGQRYTVGPQSAGANPGPACYRQRGPLTITDCNVMLGKIQPQFFPKVFGSGANQEIDVQIVHQHFQDLVNKINDATGHIKTAEEVAEGFLNIAVENMANAIKKISIQRGYDVRPYVLNCFGGAAGQHACMVADNLGIEKILIHPLAGVLSAYGMGLAEISVVHEQAIEKYFRRGIVSFLHSKFEKMKRMAHRKLKSQGLKNREMKSKRHVHLRYEGSDTQLIVEFGTMKSMREAFIAQHRKTFGFAAYRKPLIVEAITIECSIPSETDVEFTEKIIQCRSEHKIPQRGMVKVFTHGSFHNASIYLREELRAGDCIQGCAVITDNHATTIVEPGWQAEVTPKKHLLLTRYQTLATKKVDINVDPAMLEVFNNRFMNIAEQMGEVLRKTASSVNIKERLDFSCAIFDDHGELVANAPHIPVHLGSMSESVKSILKSNQKVHPNDVYALNAPYHGGTHLPDITLITPVFNKEGTHLLFLVGSRGHHADIGGITPGSIPAESRVIEEEGILINNFKMMDQGHFLEKAILTLLTEARYPARNPHQNIEDFKAQIAANARGVQALLDLVAQFGLDVVHAYMKHVRDNAALSVERLLEHLNNGEFTYSLDDGSPIKVVLTIDKQKKAGTN